MTPRRLTTLIYILLLLPTLFVLTLIFYGPFGGDTPIQRQSFTFDDSSTLSDVWAALKDIWRGEAKQAIITFLTCTILPPLTALILILWQRKKQPRYYADHMSWQLGTLLGFHFGLLALIIGMPIIFYLFLPALPLIFLYMGFFLVLGLWFYYRIGRGLIYLYEERPVY